MKQAIQNEVKKQVKQAIEQDNISSVILSRFDDWDFNLETIIIDYITDDSNDLEYDRLLNIGKEIASDEFYRIRSYLIKAVSLINEAIDTI